MAENVLVDASVGGSQLAVDVVAPGETLQVGISIDGAELSVQVGVLTQVTGEISTLSAGVSAGPAFPVSPSIKDVHFFTTAVAAGLVWCDTDGATLLTSASRGDVAVYYQGTKWVKKGTLTTAAGEGLELSGGKVRVKLDGSTLQRGAGGLKVAAATTTQPGAVELAAQVEVDAETSTDRVPHVAGVFRAIARKVKAASSTIAGLVKIGEGLEVEAEGKTTRVKLDGSSALQRGAGGLKVAAATTTQPGAVELAAQVEVDAETSTDRVPHVAGVFRAIARKVKAASSTIAGLVKIGEGLEVEAEGKTTRVKLDGSSALQRGAGGLKVAAATTTQPGAVELAAQVEVDAETSTDRVPHVAGVFRAIARKVKAASSTIAGLVKIGEGLEVEAEGKTTRVKLDGSSALQRGAGGLKVAAATTTQHGAVKIGEGLEVEAEGKTTRVKLDGSSALQRGAGGLKVAAATTTQPGAVELAAQVEVDAETSTDRVPHVAGVFRAIARKVKAASSTVAGLVKIGEGLEVEAEGKTTRVKLDGSSALQRGAGGLKVAAATTTQPGAVELAAQVEVDAETSTDRVPHVAGVFRAIARKVKAASSTVAGLVKIGEGLEVEAEGNTTRVKLDGSTLQRGAGGLKVAEAHALPAPTAANAGKVAQVKSDGSGWEAAESESGGGLYSSAVADLPAVADQAEGARVWRTSDDTGWRVRGGAWEQIAGLQKVVQGLPEAAGIDNHSSYRDVNRHGRNYVIRRVVDLTKSSKVRIYTSVDQTKWFEVKLYSPAGEAGNAWTFALRSGAGDEVAELDLPGRRVVIVAAHIFTTVQDLVVKLRNLPGVDSSYGGAETGATSNMVALLTAASGSAFAGGVGDGLKRAWAPFGHHPRAYYWLNGQTRRLPHGSRVADFPLLTSFDSSRLRYTFKAGGPHESFHDGGEYIGDVFLPGGQYGMDPGGNPPINTANVAFSPPENVYDLYFLVQPNRAGGLFSSTVEKMGVLLKKVTITGDSDDVVEVGISGARSDDVTATGSYTVPTFQIWVPDLSVERGAQFYLQAIESTSSEPNRWRGFLCLTAKGPA